MMTWDKGSRRPRSTSSDQLTEGIVTHWKYLPLQVVKERHFPLDFVLLHLTPAVFGASSVSDLNMFSKYTASFSNTIIDHTNLAISCRSWSMLVEFFNVLSLNHHLNIGDDYRTVVSHSIKG